MDARKPKLQNPDVSQKGNNFRLPIRDDQTTGSNLDSKEIQARMEKAVFLWYCQQRSIGHPVSSANLRAKATEFNAILGGPADFRANDDWFKNFQHRYKIICSTNEDTSPKTYTPKQMQDFDLSNVYNGDETILTWKSLPAGILQQVEGLSQTELEDHVTLLSCSNALGTKIPLFLIVSTENMAYFTMEINFPVVCRSNDEACMTEELFEFWFKNVFIPNTTNKTNKKILLILDGMRAHRNKKYLDSINENVTVEFIPANLTLDVQPMVLGISKSLKSNYRKLLLQELKQRINSEDSVMNFFENWSIINCYRLLSVAWEAVPYGTMVNAWSRILDFESYCEENENDVEDIMDLLIDIFKFNEVLESDVVKWIEEDENLPCCSVLSDDEILWSCFRDRKVVQQNVDPSSSKVDIKTGNITVGKVEKVPEKSIELVCKKKNFEIVRIDESKIKKPKMSSPKKAIDKVEEKKFVPSKSEALAGLSSFLRWYENRPERSEDKCKLLKQLAATCERMS